MSDDKDSGIGEKLGAAVAKYRNWIKANVPPGLRSVLGLFLIAGGLLGFLPVLGFWMVPLGVLALALDVVPLYRWLTGRKRR
ncbi:MAG: hypothetical protein KDK00_14705 [Rhodobacteraceae bacterium]|nr:hypothetical protein [Paracoccaceae bacterium]